VALVRLPRVVTVARQAFDAEAYDERAEDEWLASIDKDAARESVVRFRLKRDADGAPETDAQGRPRREGNSRVVEWADGSLTLHVGAECFSLRRAAAATAAGAGAGGASARGAA
jgi:RNA polymerase-associated protein LEO1